MEIIYGILGLAMFYAGIHSIIIIFNKIKDITTYQQVVLWVGFVTWTLYIISTL